MESSHFVLVSVNNVFRMIYLPSIVKYIERETKIQRNAAFKKKGLKKKKKGSSVSLVIDIYTNKISPFHSVRFTRYLGDSILYLSGGGRYPSFGEAKKKKKKSKRKSRFEILIRSLLILRSMSAALSCVNYY